MEEGVFLLAARRIEKKWKETFGDFSSRRRQEEEARGKEL
jgi:hypothetical protein